MKNMGNSPSRSRRGFGPRASLCAVLALAAAGAHAELEDEIQVYTDDINKPGQFGLELHLNTTPDGRTLPDYAGEVTPSNGTRLTPEFSYGLSDTFEAGLYLPMNFESNGHGNLAGYKFRLKWIPRKAPEGGGWFAGVNVEWSNLQQRYSQSRRSAEVRTIFGWRNKDWLVSVNPTFGFDLSPGFDHGNPNFDVGVKVGRKVAEGVTLGGEYYADFGGVKHFSPWNAQNHTLYFVADIDKGPLPFNIGIGRGISPAADNWTVKAIFEVPI